MCIICNCPTQRDVGNANEFLVCFSQAGFVMKKAADAMLLCANFDKKYDRTHKRMVRMIHDWNRLEQEREQEDALCDEHSF